MAAEFFYITGKCKWAKVFKPDTQFEPNAWKIDIYLDEEGLATHKESGLKTKVKEDEDGKFVGFSRKCGVFPWGDEIPPPEVVDAKGNKFEKLIGNMSTVAIEFEVYDTKKFGKGHRLNKVVVIDHVEYNKDDTPAPSSEAEKPAGKKKPAGLPF